MENNLSRILLYTAKVGERFKDDTIIEKGVIPNMDNWSDFQDDQDFCDEFKRILSYENV